MTVPNFSGKFSNRNSQSFLFQSSRIRNKYILSTFSRPLRPQIASLVSIAQKKSVSSRIPPDTGIRLQGSLSDGQPLQSVYRVTIEMECLIPQGQKPAFLVILHVKFKIKFKNYLIEKRDYIYLAQTLKEKSIQNFTIKKRQTVF